MVRTGTSKQRRTDSTSHRCLWKRHCSPGLWHHPTSNGLQSPVERRQGYGIRAEKKTQHQSRNQSTQTPSLFKMWESVGRCRTPVFNLNHTLNRLIKGLLYVSDTKSACHLLHTRITWEVSLPKTAAHQFEETMIGPNPYPQIPLFLWYVFPARCKVPTDRGQLWLLFPYLLCALGLREGKWVLRGKSFPQRGGEGKHKDTVRDPDPNPASTSYSV